jgi:Mn-dependent DtxR family transcriptional regulator
MADPHIPDDIRDFILRHIDSVAQIEALLLVRSNPQESWNLPKIAARLYINDAAAAEALDRLCADGLLVLADGTYRLEGISAENAQLIEQLHKLYTRHLIPVTNIIHSKPRRIRSFADAFKFRKG